MDLNITSDQILSANSKATNQGDVVVIEGGVVAGSNLFHSLKDLSIPSGTKVNFSASDVQNVFVRVTGESISNIDGLIQVNSSANLFLLNPKGIIFQANARLNIGGSFFATTASAIKFDDGSEFDGTAQFTNLLMMSAPIGLKFLTNSGRILVHGDGQGKRKTSNLIDTTNGLRVRSNKTLALVGDDLVLEGATLKTSGGRIELGSVIGEGIVNLSATDKGPKLRYSDFSNFGDILLSQSATVDASGDSGGDIQVQGRKLNLESSTQIEANTLGAGSGGILEINTSDSVTLMELPEVNSSYTAILSEVYEGATGKGGNLKIVTGSLILHNGARISASTYGVGDAGFVEILADSVELTRDMTPGLSSFITSVNQKGSSGNGGNIKIEVRQLTLRSGGVISVGTFGKTQGGQVYVKASEKVEVIGKSLTNSSPSRISSRTAGIGNAGDILIETKYLNVIDGGRINVGGEKVEKYIKSINRGQGNAGTLRIKASSINMDNGGTITSSTFKKSGGTGGKGGDIFLDCSNLHSVNHSKITASAGGSGSAGNITINADKITVLEQSSIAANALQGIGGNIKITTNGLFASSDSFIMASSETGINGNVQINTLEMNVSESEVLQVAQESLASSYTQETN